MPARERETIESIRTLESLSARQHLLLHPFWVHLVLLYHIIDTRKRPLDGSFDKLLAIESHLLDGSLVKAKTLDGFSQHIQDLHEILRTLITLEQSNQQDLSLIDNLFVDLDMLSNETSSLGAEYVLHSESEARL